MPRPSTQLSRALEALLHSTGGSTGPKLAGEEGGGVGGGAPRGQDEADCERGGDEREKYASPHAGQHCC